MVISLLTFVLRDFLHQLVVLRLLALQVVFDHGLPDDSWRLVLTRDLSSVKRDLVFFTRHLTSNQKTNMAFVKPTYQDAFVHVSVLHVETDPDDAAVVDLLVVQRQ